MGNDINVGKTSYTDPTTGKFSKNNPGRPRGARNRATALAQKLLHDTAGRLTETAVDLALAGEPTALRLCMARIAPPAKEPPVQFDLPPIRNADDAAEAAAAILAAVADGSLTPSEGEAVMRLLTSYVGVRELGDLEARLTALEAQASGNR
jgi:hypothetical protein